MKDIHSRLADIGLKIPEILLPAPGTDLQKWAVIACDQFTQDFSYWEKVKAEIGNSPSTLNLIFPEVYLNKADEAARAKHKAAIHAAMESYLKIGIFAAPRQCAVYLERSTPYNRTRKGLVLAIDLENYDWSPHARPLIRATEGTVPQRLPPRVDIRKDALLESTHVLLLIDDEEDSLIPCLAREAKKTAPLYNTPLMMNSGTAAGWAVDSETAWIMLADGLEALAQKADDRYGVKDKVPFLFASGDGNHSLAAARAVWEECKAAHAYKPDFETDARRFALVELENLHDTGISFEPIHRIIFGANQEKVLDLLSRSKEFSVETIKQEGNCASILRVNSHSTDIAAVHVEPLLEDFVKREGPNVSIDYIHGEDELYRLISASAQEAGPAVGILLPPINKSGFFKTIANNGPLPRKSFSMGEGCEKRFYLECRKI
jgi:hypothetical protein